MKNPYLLLVLTVLFTACKSDKNNEASKIAKYKNGEVNVYTHRHYPADQELFANFEQQTGIKVNVVNAKADELIQKMEQEGEQSSADVLIM